MTDATKKGMVTKAVTASEPVAVGSSLISFVTSSIETYKTKLQAFAKIATDAKIEDGNKLHQASIYVSAVASLIVNDFTAKNPDALKNPSLHFDVISQLLSIPSVGTAMKLGQKLWEDIGEQDHFADLDSLSAFLDDPEVRNELNKITKSMASCGCFC